jgi:hypothetical protein
MHRPRFAPILSAIQSVLEHLLYRNSEYARNAISEEERGSVLICLEGDDRLPRHLHALGQHLLRIPWDFLRL